MPDDAADVADVIARLTDPTRVQARWWTDAACAGMDVKLFFPERGGPNGEAVAVCRTCSVRLDCLTESIRNHERFGIFGGHSDRSRRRLTAAIRRERSYLLPTAPEWAAKCGTDAGYRKHLRLGETACQPCREAHSVRVYAAYRATNRGARTPQYEVS